MGTCDCRQRFRIAIPYPVARKLPWLPSNFARFRPKSETILSLHLRGQRLYNLNVFSGSPPKETSAIDTPSSQAGKWMHDPRNSSLYYYFPHQSLPEKGFLETQDLHKEVWRWFDALMQIRLFSLINISSTNTRFVRSNRSYFVFYWIEKVKYWTKKEYIWIKDEWSKANRF